MEITLPMSKYSDNGDEEQIVDDCEDLPPAKKAKKADAPQNLMGNPVNSKKVGRFVLLMNLATSKL